MDIEKTFKYFPLQSKNIKNKKCIVTITNTFHELTYMLLNCHMNHLLINQCFDFVPDVLERIDETVSCIIFEQVAIPILKIEILGREATATRGVTVDLDLVVQEIQNTEYIQGIRRYSAIATCMFVGTFALLAVNFSNVYFQTRAFC
jgi:hypothetical protein